MQTVGARRTFADLAFVSSAKCWPTVYKRSLFHVAANEIPHGNKAAYTRAVIDRTLNLDITTNLGASHKNTASSAVGAIARLDCRYAFGWY